MKAHIISDIHFEIRNKQQKQDFWTRLEAKKGEADTLFLAGDIGSLKNSKVNELLDTLHHFEELYQKVYYTAGNHEYWGCGIQRGNEILNRWSEKVLPKTTCLMPGEIHGNVSGGTLWYPDCQNPIEKRYWCDYQYISDSYTMIEAEHNKFIAQKELTDIVATHHFPTSESIEPRWAGESTNVFFCAFLENWLGYKVSKLPKLFLHGHTHNPMDYVSKFGFRVYCNPLGYPNENANNDFWDRLLIEV